MRATSPLQLESMTSGTVPELEQVRDDVWALGLPMPNGYMPYSLLYLLRDVDGGVHVIDPGWDSDDNEQRLLAALSEIGSASADVRSIIVTHLHADHAGMASRLRDRTGAPVLMLGAEADTMDTQAMPAETVIARLSEWEVPKARVEEITEVLSGIVAPVRLTVDRALVDGEQLDIPGFSVVAMHTPGHTPGHLCLRDDERSLLFTGDTLLPMMHPGLGLGGPSASNPVADYLASIEAIGAYPDHEVLPGHGYRFDGLAERAAASAAHHSQRAREVGEVLAMYPDDSVWQIASRLTWTAGWENLSGFYLFSALAQTAMHRDYVRANRSPYDPR